MSIYMFLIDLINLYHKKLFLSIIMTEYEIKQIQDYLNHKLKTNRFLAKKRKSIDDSCEIFLMMSL